MAAPAAVTAANVAVTPRSGSARLAGPRQPAAPPDPSRQPGAGRPRLRPVHIVCWQLAAALVAAALGHGPQTIAAAVAGAVVLVGLTATWRDGLWTYEWAWLGLRYGCRPARFQPLDAYRGRVAIGNVEAASLIGCAGATVVLETGCPPDALPDPASLLDGQRELHAKLVAQHGRAWIAVTATRSVSCHRDEDLGLALANAVRRLAKRLQREHVPVRPLTDDALAATLAALAPETAVERWDHLVLGGARYRMYAAPAAVVTHDRGGAVLVSRSSDRETALALLPADLHPGPGFRPLPGRQRRAFAAALPG